jgi:DNA-binding PadR family transcriptional regulator
MHGHKHRHHHPHHGEGSGPGERARRGEARYVFLDVLRDGPKHGYEIIKVLEERTQGRYAPSPGTVYPTLQYLEDLGLVRSVQAAERRVYQLTEAGQVELEAHADALKAFWARFGGLAASSASQTEIGFLEEEIAQLMRTVWNCAHQAAGQDDPAVIRRVRHEIEQCRNEIRRIIAEPDRKTKENNDAGTTDAA